jgi:hypothetical protein
MSLTVHPELDLPKNLEVCYSNDILDWVRKSLPGMRYITLKKVISRGKYEQFARINVQETPNPGQLPQEKSDVICDLIYRVLQYKQEEVDDTVDFLVQIYSRTTTGDKPTGKHITIGTNGTGDIETKQYDPETVAPNVLDAQMQYIQMLQDNTGNLYAQIAGMIQPIIESNKTLQAELAAKRADDYQLKNLEYVYAFRNEERQAALAIEQAKIKASKDKWDSFSKMLNKNGALDKLMLQAANKFMGDGSNNVQVEPPRKVTQVNQMRKDPFRQPTPKPPEPPKMSEEEELAIQQKVMEDSIKTIPLYTYCSYLKDTLETEARENPEENAKKYIEETIRDSLYKDLIELLNSESEEDAKKNLLQFRNNIDPNDYSDLASIQNVLNETQKTVIGNIMSYNPEE